MATATGTQPTLNAGSGTTRAFAVGSCFLQPEDLRRLYSLLSRRSREITELSVARIPRQPGQTDEQLEQVREYARSLLQLVVTTQARDGGWSRATGAELLQDTSLPDSLSEIVFDSAFLFREQTKAPPQNYFVVTLDFSRTKILDLTNLAQSPEPNKSSVLIVGTNDTWVKAVHDDLRAYFDERSSGRAWLHNKYVYDVLLPLLGIPLSIDLDYHVNRIFGHIINPSLAIAVPLYFLVFLYGLLGFRILFNYVRWVFPKVESTSRKSWPKLHRALIALIGVSMLTFIINGILAVISSRR